MRHDATALGIAASLASGLKENFGSMTKPFHAGHAARNGVWAAMLAREGLTVSESALDGPQGYLPPSAARQPGRRASTDWVSAGSSSNRGSR